MIPGEIIVKNTEIEISALEIHVKQKSEKPWRYSLGSQSIFTRSINKTYKRKRSWNYKNITHIPNIISQ